MADANQVLGGPIVAGPRNSWPSGASSIGTCQKPCGCVVKRGLTVCMPRSVRKPCESRSARLTGHQHPHRIGQPFQGGELVLATSRSTELRDRKRASISTSTGPATRHGVDGQPRGAPVRLRASTCPPHSGLARSARRRTRRRAHQDLRTPRQTTSTVASTSWSAISSISRTRPTST